MAKAIYVKFDTPEELANQAEEALKTAQDSGKVAKGTNEVTKFIERGDAALVVIAEDVDPAEIVAHIPVLADEKEIPYIYLPTKEQVGGAAGLTVGTASACIVDAGDAEGDVAEIVEKIAELKSLALLDAMFLPMCQYKDDTVDNIESVLAPPVPKPQVQPTQSGKETAPVKKKVVRAYNRQVVFQAKTLQTDADIDDYVEKIRSQLKQLLKNCDEIKLN